MIFLNVYISGRVGTDFRGALVPIFQRRILELCLKTIRRATVKFRKNYETLLEVAYHGWSFI